MKKQEILDEQFIETNLSKITHNHIIKIDI